MVLALAAAVRVVNRVHDRTADGRTNASPTRATGLADNDVGVLGIADLTDGGAAAEKNAAQLRRRKTQNGVPVVLTHELNGSTGGASHRSAFTGLELNRVHKRTDRNLLKCCAVAGLDVDVLYAGDNSVTDSQSLRAKDVRLRAIRIVQKRNACGAVWIVLDRSNLRGNIVLAALEVDAAILTLVSTALMTCGNAAVVIATGFFRQGLEKRLLGLISRNL